MLIKRIIIMAGGTGGHVFPGLSLAKLCREQGIEVHWMGTEVGLESLLVPRAGFPIHYIKISGIRGKGITKLITTPYKFSYAIWQAHKVIKEINPDLLIGMGGFASGPGGFACWLLKKPLVIHEQNAKPGLTNKYLAYFAKKVLEGFPNTFKERKNSEYLGNPIRPEIEKIPHPSKRFQTAKRLKLLVLGGSLGAKSLNEMVPHAINTMPPELRPELIHQTGQKTFNETIARYESLGLDVVQVVPFIDRIEEAYQWADMVLCRSGALTISELCCAGLGAILVPYPYAVDDHQTANAEIMVKNNAALLIQQDQLTVEKLATVLADFSKHTDKCYIMANNAYLLRKTNVTEKILELCKEIYA